MHKVPAEKAIVRKIKPRRKTMKKTVRKKKIALQKKSSPKKKKRKSSSYGKRGKLLERNMKRLLGSGKKKRY